MSAEIVPLPVLQLDGNGLPRNHYASRDLLVERLMEMVNELPDGIAHLWKTDAEWLVDNLLTLYNTNNTKGSR